MSGAVAQICGRGAISNRIDPFRSLDETSGLSGTIAGPQLSSTMSMSWRNREPPPSTQIRPVCWIQWESSGHLGRGPTA